ncbi:hypothetical protein MKW98_027216, partial [Papaver atlanticum]
LPVEYPWKPPRCDMCKVFGQLSKSCNKSKKARWAPAMQEKSLQKIHSSLQENSGVGVTVPTREDKQDSTDLDEALKTNEEEVDVRKDGLNSGQFHKDAVVEVDLNNKGHN